MKLKFLVLAVAAAVSAGAQAQVGIANGDIKATIGDNGVFYDAPGGPGVGLSYKGVEFVNIDTMASWAVLSAGGTDYKQEQVGGTNDLASSAFGPFALGTTTLVSSFGPVSMTQTVSISSANTLSFTWLFTNTTGRDLKDVKWSFGFDPDQDGSGSNTTVNTIVGTGTSAAVKAVGPLSAYEVTLFNNTSAAAFASEAYIGPSCCSTVTGSTIIGSGQGLLFTTTSDDSINLGWDIGTLAGSGIGSTATLGATLVFAVPEPETYALFMAGLGLMGFVARRRIRA